MKNFVHLPICQVWSTILDILSFCKIKIVSEWNLADSCTKINTDQVETYISWIVSCFCGICMQVQLRAHCTHTLNLLNYMPRIQSRSSFVCLCQTGISQLYIDISLGLSLSQNKSVIWVLACELLQGPEIWCLVNYSCTTYSAFVWLIKVATFNWCFIRKVYIYKCLCALLMNKY